MENGQVELRISGVSVERDDAFVVLEEKATARKLAVPVGPFEASAIVLEMECVYTPRPLAHVLLAEIFQEGGFVLERVELADDPGGNPRATLSYRKGLRRFEKDVRPSDALALALRLGSPVIAEASMLARREDAASPWRRPNILALSDWKTRAMRA